MADADLNQLTLIFDILGRPPAQDLWRLPQRQQEYIRTALPSGTKTPWNYVFYRKLKHDLPVDYIVGLLDHVYGPIELPPLDEKKADAALIAARKKEEAALIAARKQEAHSYLDLMIRYDDKNSAQDREVAQALRNRWKHDYAAFQRGTRRYHQSADPDERNQAMEANFFWKLSEYRETHADVYQNLLEELAHFPDAYPLLDELLTFNPAKRPTAMQALAHPWLAGYHNEDDEPVPKKDDMKSTIFWFEKQKNGFDKQDLQGKTAALIANT